jgi:hypothetical protein
MRRPNYLITLKNPCHPAMGRIINKKAGGSMTSICLSTQHANLDLGRQIIFCVPDNCRRYLIVCNVRCVEKCKAYYSMLTDLKVDGEEF